MDQAGVRGHLGIGWKFPLQVTPNGKIAQSHYEQRVEESIYLILGTAKGERVMLPEFGCGIHDMVFAPNNSTTVSIVTHLVREALVECEPRIDVMDVHVDAASGQPTLLLIAVSYRIRSTNTIGNLVYPFYITEGK